MNKTREVGAEPTYPSVDDVYQVLRDGLVWGDHYPGDFVLARVAEQAHAALNDAPRRRETDRDLK
jgi:hypothetical protein